MAYCYRDGFLAVDSGEFQVRSLLAGYQRPIYFYNTQDIEKRVQALKTAFDRPVHLHYAVKANAHSEILKTLREIGCGADVVSIGEMQLALNSGFLAEQIVFSGVGKTRGEIRKALELGVGQLNVESPSELARIASIAKELGFSAPVAFRMNPDVNPNTHPYIKTGFRDNKFGMDFSLLSECLEIYETFSSSLDLRGLTMHIGSQLRDLEALCEATEKLRALFDQLVNKGYPLKTLDLGGGLGIDYQNFAGPSEFDFITEYGQRFSKILEGFQGEVHLEPGRILVARSGLLITQVQYIKKTPYKNFAIVDTGMHHLLRPALYQGFHRILPLQEPTTSGEFEIYDVVGPICESSDVLGADRLLPRLQEGDFLAIADVGAYGRSMASGYNVHEFPLELTWPAHGNR